MTIVHSNLTIIESWQRSVRANGEKTALIFEDRNWTYQQLDNAVKSVAISLLEKGFEQGDRLAAYGKNSDVYLITFLSCLYAGIVHVPINFSLRKKELAYILEQSGSKGIICDPELYDNLSHIRPDCKTLTFEALFFSHGSTPAEIPNIFDLTQAPSLNEFSVITQALDSNIQIMYTSGTTSLPKGAVMTNQCLMTQYIGAIMHLDIKSTDCSLAALPLYHTAQMHVFTLPALLVGATTILIKAPEPDKSLTLIERHKINSFFAPPTVWIGLLHHPNFMHHDLSTLEKLYYGAAAMPEAIVHELSERLPKAGLYNCYGQTEMSPLATVLLPEEHAGRPTSAGKPIFFVETRIVDEKMNDTPVGERGEIIHRSPQVMKEYWNKPRETQEAFDRGWFHSGDIGTFDEQGYLYIVDRVKDVINTGGVLVASREVEEILYQHEDVAEVAVIGTPHEKWIEAVTAVVVLKNKSQITEAALIDHCKNKLAGFKVPKNVEFVDALPKNASGKVLKRELRAQIR